VLGAEVVNAAEQEHIGVQGLLSANQRTGASRQRVNSLAKGRIEALNVGRIDDPAALAFVEQLCHLLTRALHNAPLDSKETGATLFDDLNDIDIGPSNSLGSARVPPV
jgi:hypothetical protein